MKGPRCPACGGKLVDGILVGSTALLLDSRPRFVPAATLHERSLIGRYRSEIITGARACSRCGAVTLFVSPAALDELLSDDGNRDLSL